MVTNNAYQGCKGQNAGTMLADIISESFRGREEEEDCIQPASLVIRMAIYLALFTPPANNSLHSAAALIMPARLRTWEPRGLEDRI